MGLEIHSSPWIEVMRSEISGLTMEVDEIKSSNFCDEDAKMNLRSGGYCQRALHESLSFKNWERENNLLEKSQQKCDLHAAAVKLQKVYKSYRTRRNLADCAVVVEELWFVSIALFFLEYIISFWFSADKSLSSKIYFVCIILTTGGRRWILHLLNIVRSLFSIVKSRKVQFRGGQGR